MSRIHFYADHIEFYLRNIYLYDSELSIGNDLFAETLNVM